MSLNDIKYHSGNRIAYINNPKAGCTTIKNSMHKGCVGNIHHRSSFEVYSDVSVPLFSVVRNPFTRILSAYLDKVGPGSDINVWRPFCSRYKLLETEEISFINFLRILDCEHISNRLDPHFRPQVDNLMADIITPSFIGYLEDLNSVQKFLSEFGISIRSRVPHGTDANKKLNDYMSEEAYFLICKIYKSDFEEYGYSFDYSTISCPSHPLVREQYVDPSLICHKAGKSPAKISRVIKYVRKRISAIAMSIRD